MDRPSKRRRLFAPPDRELPRSFDNRHEYYEATDDLYEEDSEPAYDTGQDLQQKRARLDLKLKSTFESIFEKYGKDFEGVGDEIDLYTGEILVNNGHLQQMQNERDAGESSRARRIQRALADDDDELETSSVDDDYLEEDEDEDEEDYANDDAPSDEDMIEDDMILRGFAQARELMERRPTLQQNVFDTVLGGRMDRGWNSADALHPVKKAATLPSRSTILSQFGPQLGPEIVKYISDQAALEDDNVEPMWRAPPIWPTTSVKRPAAKSTTYQLAPERPVSPENSPSIWAPARSIFKAEDDKVLQDFVADAHAGGLNLSNNESWKALENAHPRHGWRAWKMRYEKKFSYLYAQHAEESELSTSEVSTDVPWESDHHDLAAEPRLGFAGSSLRYPAQPPANGRPARVRKQAVRDPTILSWNDAVATIKSVDPDLHAGLLRDAKNMRQDASFDFQRLEPSSPIAAPQIIQDRTPKTSAGPNKEAHSLLKLSTHSSGLFDDAEDELSLHSEFHSASQMAPCPHTDCQHSQSTLYRLNYADGEELSPLCLHLLHVHHITPYPCAEFNCDRKGERGYFLQEDLVKHVREAHPYATAISRLRGRVDAELLGPKVNTTGPKLSTDHRPRTPVSQPRELNFVSPRRPTVQRVQPRTAPTSSSAQGLTQNPLPAQSKSMPSAAASLLHLHQSTQKMPESQAREYSVEKLYDSDVEILDGNPLLAEKIPSTKQTNVPRSFRTSVSDNPDETAPREMASTRSIVPSTDQGKARCTYSGCTKMISTSSPRYMIAHLKAHEQRDSNNTTNTAPRLQSLLPASVPDSLSLALNNSHDQASGQVKGNNNRTRRTRRSEPLPRNTVDPSYVFSDEELELPPLAKEAPKLKGSEAAQPRLARKSMPLPKTSANASLDSASKKIPAVTPFTKPISRKIEVQGNTDNKQDLDELSLPDVLYVSSRPRIGAPFSARAQPQVKEEGVEVGNGNVQSSRKRRVSMLERSDEVDELGSDEIMLTTPVRRGPFSPGQPEVKTEQEEAIARSRSLPKSRATTISKTGGQNKSPLPGPLEAVVTPTTTRTSHKQAPGTSTPLIDLVGDDDDDDDNLGMARPTSEQGFSSPTVRALQSRLLTGRLVAGPSPSLRRTAGLRGRTASVKREGDENSVVWTPGGTLRRCGQDGFTCGRPFCFSCPQRV